MLPSDRGSKKTTRETIAKKAREQYMGTASSGRDSKIVKSIKSLFKPNTQQDNGGLKKSPVKSAGSSLYDRVVAFDKRTFGNVKAPKPIREAIYGDPNYNNRVRSATGGQFAHAGAEHIQLYVDSLYNKEYNRALAKAGSHMGALAVLRAEDDNKGVVRQHLYQLDNERHNELITNGSLMRDDVALVNEYDAFLQSDKSQYDLAVLENLSERIESDQAYYDEWTRPEIFYDTETKQWVDTRVYRKDAPLPPWVPPTAENQATWEYYLNYQDVTFSAQKKASADAHSQEVLAKHYGYKSAMSEADGIGVENSLIDAVIADFRDGGKDGKDHIGQYFKDYIVAPIKAHKFRPLVGNVLMGLGDTLDTFARGERAILAANKQLGGFYDEGHSGFENQNIYWINLPGYRTDELHDAQRLFIQSGGLSLFNDDRLEARLEGVGMSREEREQYLSEQFAKSGISVPWQDVRDAIENEYYGRSASEQFNEFVTQARRNLNKTYKLAGYDFNANTGDLASDIVIETLSDPGLLFGGIAKSIVKGGVKETSKNAVMAGFRSIASDVDIASLINNPKVQAAIKHLGKVDDGRNIIFKRSEALASDVNILSRTLVDAGVIDNLSSQRFSDAVLAELVERGKSMNAGIVANSPKFLSKVDNKLLKTAYYVDKGIDGIDTLLLKTSFAPPFIMAGALKRFKKGLNASQIGSLLARKRITNGEVVQALIKGEGKGVRVMTENLMQTANASKVTQRDLMRGVRAIRTEFDNTAEAIQRTIQRIRNGKINIQDASAEVDEYIRLLTNGDYKTLSEAEQWVETLDPLYRSEYQKGLETLKAAKRQFDKSIDMFNNQANQSFLNELKTAITNGSSYDDVFEKYAGHVDFHFIRSDIENLIGEAPTHLLIESTTNALKNGTLVTSDDVLRAIQAVTDTKALNVTHRGIDAKDLRRVVPKDLQASFKGKGDQWLFNDLSGVLNRKGTVNYLDIYDAIDHSMYKLSYIYAKKPLRKYSEIYNQLKAFQDALRKSDVIATNSVETISNYHLDLHTALTGLLRDAKIRNMLDEYYDNMYSGAFKELEKLNFSDIPIEEQQVALAVQQLRRRRETIRMYETFEDNIRNITGISDQKAYAICSAVLGHYNGGRDVLTEITRNADGVHDYINELLYNNYGGSKLNMRVLRNQVGSLLTSQPDEFFAGSRFIDELKKPENEDVREWLSGKVSANLDDPQAYADMQMLSVLTMNPAEVKRLNHLIEVGEQPYIIHTSTTGLNPEVDSITGIGYRKWQYVDDPDNINLRDIYELFQREESVEFKVRMTDDQITDSISHANLKAIYTSEDSDIVLRDRFTSLFGGATTAEDVKSEGDILEEFFGMLYKEQTAGQHKRKVIKPYSFVVHDLQSASGRNAFNMRMLNSRASVYAADKTKPFTSQYSNGLSRRTATKTTNTLSGFRDIISDNGLTQSEFFAVEREIKEYAAKRAQARVSSYHVMDLDGYVDESFSLHDLLSNYTVTDASSTWLKTLVANNQKYRFDGAGVMQSINSVKSANDLAKQYVGISGKASNRLTGSLSSAAPSLTKELSRETHKALEDIAALFGVDITLAAPSGDASRGYHWEQTGNMVLGTNEINLNPYYQSNVVETFMHELRHNWSLSDDYGRPFKAKIENALVQDLGFERDVWMYSLLPESKRSTLQDPLAWYINYIGSRYSNLEPMMDAWMDEFVAPIFQHYFTNREALMAARRKMVQLGFDTTAEGHEALKFLDAFSTVVRNSDEFSNWSGKIINADISDMHHALHDCLDRIVSDDDLLEEFANSILHTIKNKDQLQAEILDVVSRQNLVTAARGGANGANVLNVAVKNSVENIRRYYSLGDTYASEQALIKRDLMPGATTSEGLVHTVDKTAHLTISHSFSTLEKMDDTARYIAQVRNTDLTSNAADLLQPYNDDAGKFLNFVRDFAIANTNLTGASTYDHLKYIIYSRDSIDNYLMSQKVFDDIITLFEGKGLEQQTPFLKEFRSAYEQAIGKEFSADFVSVLDGSLDLRIYKSGRIKDAYVRRFHYTINDLQNEIDLANYYRNATHEIASNITQRDHASLRLMLNGIKTAEDSMVGRAWQSTLTALQKCGDKVKSKKFQQLTHHISVRYNEVLQQYRLARLRGTDGLFDKDLLLSELLWNGHNHIVFQTARYSSEQMDELISFVNKIRKDGMDFISCETDPTTKKLYIYLNNKIDVFADTLSPVEKRYVVYKDGKYSRSYVRPEYQNLHSAEVLRIDMEDGVQELMESWQNIDILSGGLSRGTSGRVLSEREIEHYYNTLPSFMKDMASPQNMIDTRATSRLVYDPGFIIEGDTDYFLDMLDTMRYQNQVMNNGTATLAYMFGNGSPTKFGHIMQDVTDDEILQFFSRESDFVVATVVPNNNFMHGVEIKQLRMDNPGAIEFARNSDNAVILPYDAYLSVAGDINRSTNPTSISSTFNKALLVIKAFQLCNVGSWVRNWYDATKKAAMDMGESPSNTWTILMYQGKAMRDFWTFRKILKSYDGYVDGHSWDIIQKTFNTDMTYEDFEVLSNLFHSSSTTRDTKFFKKNAWQKLSGNEGSVRGLSEQDIRTAFAITFRKKKPILSDKMFFDIHQGRVVPNELEKQAYEDTIREIDTSLRSTRLNIMPQKAMNIMFHPFSLSENIVRYAQTQYLRDFGFTDGQISKRIHLTQFSSRRSDAAGYLEYVIPYVNYTLDNCMYWMRMIEENPRYFKYFMDAYGNMVSSHIEDLLDQGQQFDIERDNLVHTGGIPIGHDGLYFKLNPSFMDFVNNMYGGWVNVVDKLNPLLNIATRDTLSDFGFNSHYFFSELDLNISEDDLAYNVSSIIPIINQIYSTRNAYKNVKEYFGDAARMSTKALFTIFSPLFGLPKKYGRNAGGTFEEWQEELAKQGKWFDCNSNTIVDLEQENKQGANNPENTWEDRQAYMLVHFGKVWDGNVSKWVDSWERTDGGFNDVFDFENDPTAWDRLCELYYKRKGMVFDYNTGHFVLEAQLSDGDLNDSAAGWERRCSEVEEKFNVVWDSNQNAFVSATADDWDVRQANMYVRFDKVWDKNSERFMKSSNDVNGGLNDPSLNGAQRAALRIALFGKIWDDDVKAYKVVQEPSIVMLDNIVSDDSENMYALLGIPRLTRINVDSKLHLSEDGFLMTDRGQYILTGNDVYNQRLFNKFTDPYKREFKTQDYSQWHHYNYDKLNTWNKKPQKVNSSYDPYTFLSGYGWNAEDGYYRYEFSQYYQMRYKGVKPHTRIRRVTTPHIHYVYGGGYGKFAYYTR